MEMTIREIELDIIALQLQGWIDFETEGHKDCCPATDETAIMAPPVWPSIGVIKEWIRVMRECIQTEKTLLKILDRNPYIDDGDCGTSACFYCGEDELEEKHADGCIYEIVSVYKRAIELAQK